MPSYDFTKDPDAILDYSFDWSQWLSAGETISTSSMFTSPGITINSTTNTTTVTTAWLSGGTSGNPYTLTNRIVTSQARTDDRTMTIRVQDR